jgi:glyoxylase-like metal-dependent hydrolase (beta-lactamase superfamily II)
MHAILDDISMWSRLSERHQYNFNGHLVCLAGGNLCIDPVEPDSATLDELARVGVSRIILTNRNHVRAANSIRGRTGARTAIHPDDAAYARAQGAQIDATLRPDERVAPFVVVGVPGKSPGEVALHWPERRLLIVGDAVIGNPPGSCSLLPHTVMDNPTQLRHSVRALLDLDFDTLLVGDGEPILRGAKDRLRALVSAFPD